VDLRDETYRANRAAQLALLEQLSAQLELAIAGGGDRYQQRHRGRGRLGVRERIELLVDPDSPFLELSALAAWGTEFTVGASEVTGIGVISGVECVIIGHDPTVRGGSMNPYSLRKTLRALEIARTNRLPVMNLVESGGADLPTQADLFVPAGRIFHELTELSANAVPTVALVFGNSTAGGAYVPGMCDYAVLVDGQAKVFLGGPRWSRWPPARNPTTNRSVAPRCTPGCPVFPTTSPSTSTTRSASAAPSWPGSTGASTARHPGRPCRPATTRTRSSVSCPPT
jgi:acetyl-CoA carboxylase carboxyltransferase component